MTSPISPRDLRVSDAERDHVISVLQKAIGHGLIDLDEFTRRTDVALAAKTRGELNVVLVDLPGLFTGEAQDAAEPEHLRANMSTVRRTGGWEVPEHLVVHNRMGTVELDFTSAVINHKVVHVELDNTAGSVDLTIPDGARCDLSDLRTSIGGEITERGVREQGVSAPKFVLSGLVRAGSLTIRRETRYRFGKLAIKRNGGFTWQ
ncbi:DUF1707 SHOCT-like domain-containing protein [Actinokineospora pegani]|uniref:DUF1707 SHOCT-like domain-containing protein n=1 Tax=Actinokineospora pegani TaxID=2654637 RepID=UPI0012EA74E8|nr:DUF1707 domain-containing protein [Actinokineospora pegani]